MVTCPSLSMLMRLSEMSTAASSTEWKVGSMLICITKREAMRGCRV